MWVSAFFRGAALWIVGHILSLFEKDTDWD
jgi:hypothetical protein